MKFKVIDGYVLLDGEYKWKGEIIEVPNDERREIWLEKRAIEPVSEGPSGNEWIDKVLADHAKEEE